MAAPRIIDAVTLRHFAAVDRLDILEFRLVGYEAPRCSGTVFSEVFVAAGQEEECERILDAGILGSPLEVELRNFNEVFRIRRALSLDETESQQHLGEAESIFLASKLHGTFITDDTAAYAYAEKYLGDNRVLDTVDLLREGVAADDLNVHVAKQIADGIRNSGRSLRGGHPWTLTAEYFEIGTW